MFSTLKLFSFCLFLVVISGANCSVVKRAITGSQSQCVRLLTNHLTDNELGCVNAAQAITTLLEEGDNIVNELDSLSTSIFEQFCRPSCGGSIFKAWETCNITQNYGRQVQLIATLCGSQNNKFCYDDISGLFNFISSVENCQIMENQCSSECRNLINEGEGEFRCCVNVPISYRTAGGETNLAAVVDATFEKCDERREEDCSVLIFDTIFFDRITNDNQSLNPEQILCIDTNIEGNNILTSECKATSKSLMISINSGTLFTSLQNSISELEEFCDPTCGPAIINAWRSCNAYERIQTDAEYIIGQCGLNQNTPCYSYYDRIFTGFFDSAYCAMRSNSLTCPSGCQPVYRKFSEVIGCCGAPSLNYIDATFGGGTGTVRNASQEIYNRCGFQLPSQCSGTALTASSQQTTPQSTPQPSMCPSSAAISVSSSLLCAMSAVIYLLDLFYV